MSERVFLTIQTIRYEWHGSFGSVLASRERGRRPGDVRYIKGHLFYAYMIHRCGRYWWSKPEVSWIPILDMTLGWIRDFKQELFGTKGESR